MTTSAPPSKPRKKRSVAPKHETIVRAFKFAMDVPEAKSGQLFEANIVQAIAFGTVSEELVAHYPAGGQPVVTRGLRPESRSSDCPKREKEVSETGTCCSVSSSLLVRAGVATRLCDSDRDNVSNRKAKLAPRGDGKDCQHQGGREARLDGMVNVSELPINAVMTNKPKMLVAWTKRYVAKMSPFREATRRCSATGEQAGPNPSRHLSRNRVSPYRRPSPSGTTPYNESVRIGGKPLAVRVKERGKSERRSVIERTGVERHYMMHRHHPTGNRADFRMVSHHENARGIFGEGKANDCANG